jgi:hypothetical protein
MEIPQPSRGAGPQAMTHRLAPSLPSSPTGVVALNASLTQSEITSSTDYFVSYTHSLAGSSDEVPFGVDGSAPRDRMGVSARCSKDRTRPIE